MDTPFLDVFWSLASEESSTRREACVALTQQLLKKEPRQTEYAVRRLCRGLESTRRGAKEGFAAALALAVETDALRAQDVLREVQQQASKTGDKAEQRALDLAVLLGCLAIAKREPVRVVELALRILEKRKWLREVAARCCVEACPAGADAVRAWLGDRPIVEPEELALKLACGDHVDELDGPLTLAARVFPGIHVAWDVALATKGRKKLWKIVDEHASAGTLERRGVALLLAARVANDDPKALSPAVCACLAKASRKDSNSHLAPLARRILKQLAKEDKPDKWRIDVAASLLAADVDKALVEPFLTNVSEASYATALARVALETGSSGAVSSLRARDSAPARCAALVASARLACFDVDETGAESLATAHDVKLPFARRLATRAAARQDAPDPAKQADFWAVVAACFTAAPDKPAWLRAVLATRSVFVPPVSIESGDDLVSLWAACELAYGTTDEEARDVIQEALAQGSSSLVDEARRCCSLLAVAHDAPSARAARVVLGHAFSGLCAKLGVDAATIKYLVDVASGIDPDAEEDEDVDKDVEEEEEDEEEDDEEDDEEEDDAGEFDELRRKDEEEDVVMDDEAEEEDDIVLDDAGAAALLMEKNEAGSALLAARQAHRKAGRGEARKRELQLQLRVLDLVDRALKRSGEQCASATIEASMRFAHLVRELEGDDLPEARDLVKRLGGLGARLRSAKLGRAARDPDVRVAASLALTNVVELGGKAATALQVCHTTALCVRVFADGGTTDGPASTAASALERAAQLALGSKRPKVKLDVVKDCVKRAPALALRAVVRKLADLIDAAPSAFLKLEAVSLAKDLLHAAGKADYDVTPFAAGLAACLASVLGSDDAQKKTDRLRKVLDCAATLVARVGAPNELGVLRDAVAALADRWQPSPALSSLAAKVLGDAPPAKRRKV